MVTADLEAVREQLAARGGSGLDSLARIDTLAAQRREQIAKTEALRADRNAASKAMAQLDKSSAEFAEKRGSLKALGAEIKGLAESLEVVERELEDLCLHLPNLPDPSVPRGDGEADNVVVRTWGDKPVLDFEPKDHHALGTDLGVLDFERGAKISGSRFTVLRGGGAGLVRGLISFMVDLHIEEHGYEELWPPALVKDSALRGTGQLPKFENDAFHVDRHYAEGDDTERVRLFLSPTAEVQLTNFHADEIFDVGELPRQYTAYTPCFRSEAGSHGRDTRGLIRQHQFDKVELVHFCEPENSLARLELLTGHAEEVLQRLGLHYRVVELCTGDLGFSSAKTYDLEVWLPGQDNYREISSCSWFRDFQARRAKIRFRSEVGKKPKLAHTLNGSGLAVGRTLVAILEQYQQADGSVIVPEALRGYVGGLERLSV